MLHIDEWTDFEAHDITELALSVSDEIYGSVEEGIRELNLLDEWLDEHGVSHPQRIAANLFAGYPEKYLKPAPDWWPWEE